MIQKFDPVTASRRWMLYVILVALFSWMGLWGIVQLPVTDATKAIFFVLLFAAITCTIMPPIAHLNARFGQCHDQRTYQVRFSRQSVWIGLFVVVAGWLQMRRILSATLALILMAVFVLTETFLITRESPSKGS